MMAGVRPTILWGGCMKRLMLGLVLFSQFLGVKADLLGRNEAENRYEALKALIASAPNNLDVVMKQLNEYANVYSKDASHWGSTIDRYLIELAGLKAPAQSASLDLRRQARNFFDKVSGPISVIQGDIDKIKKSPFAKKEKRFVLDLYKAVVETIKKQAASLRDRIFALPLPEQEVALLVQKVKSVHDNSLDVFIKKLSSQPWRELWASAALEKEGVANQLRIKEIEVALDKMSKKTADSSDEEKITAYRQEALAFQKPTTIYGSIMKGLAPILIVGKTL